MLVKIESNYTVEEVRALYACLVMSGLLSQHDIDKLADSFNHYETGYYQLNFSNINDLLLPFLDRFAGYDKEEIDLAIYDNNPNFFYRNLTLRLLNGSPLKRHDPTCSIDSNTRELAIRGGQLETRFNFRTFPEYLVQVTAHLNLLLQRSGADVAYYELEFDEATRFLLLTERQYCYLLTHRALRFAQVEYSEIEAWRKTISLEDLPF